MRAVLPAPARRGRRATVDMQEVVNALRYLVRAGCGWRMPPVLATLRRQWPEVRRLFADGAYDRTKLLDRARALNFVVEVVRRHPGQNGFKLLPRRWMVER